MALGMRGGVRYEYRLPKDLSVLDLPLCTRLLFAIPEGYTTMVREGDAVLRDGILASHSDGSVMVSTTCGMVGSVTDDTIEIIPLENNEEELPLFEDFASLNADAIVETVRKYGIFTEDGLPLWRILSKMKGSGELLILNAVENQPGVYSAHGVLDAMPEKIAGGLKILMKALALGKAVIATTDGMQRTAVKVQKHFHKKDMVQIVTVADKYPVSHPRILYRTLTGSEREPSLRNAVIVSVHDCIAVYDLFSHSHTASSRVVTIGERNYRVYIGTPLSDLAGLCDIIPPKGTVCHVGGYVSAREVKNNESITMSTVSVQYLFADILASGECIECGKCAECCPVGLHPMHALKKNGKDKWFDTARMSCIDCGVCTSVCPVGIALNQIIRQRGSKHDT